MYSVQSVVHTLIIKRDMEILVVAVSINITNFLWFRYWRDGDKFLAVQVTSIVTILNKVRQCTELTCTFAY
jgi:hypothetical protein